MSQPLILLLKCICCGKRLFGTSMLVLLCLMVGETANAGNYGCIKLSTTYFNLDDGSRYTAVLPYLNNQDYAALTFSGDGRYAAYAQANKLNNDSAPATGSLIIVPVNSVGEFGASVVVRTHLPLPQLSAGGWTTDTEFEWSKDSRWLLYRWQEPRISPDSMNQQYAAITTVSGNTDHRVSLPSAYEMHLDGQSADGFYAGLTIQSETNDPMERRIAFLRIPALTFRFALPLDQGNATHACFEPFNADLQCLYWSPLGHRAVIPRLSADGSKADWVVVDPAQSSLVATFPISSVDQITFAGWSQDGSQFATYTPGGEIDSFSIRDNHDQLVTKKAVTADGGDGSTVVSLRWCDGNNLIYIEQSDANSRQITIYSGTARQSVAIGLTQADSLDGLADGSLATHISVDCKDTYTLEKSLLEDNTSYESVVDGVTRRQIPLITLPDQVNANRRWFPGNLAVAWRTTTIAWMNADGTNRHEIVKDADIVPIAINGDTMLFAVTPTIPPQTSDLYLANLKTGEDQLVLKGIGDSNSLKVAWSADRSLFAIYPSTLDPGNGALDVFTHNGKPLRHFDQLPAISDAGQTLTWLPSCGKAR